MKSPAPADLDGACESARRRWKDRQQERPAETWGPAFRAWEADTIALYEAWKKAELELVRAGAKRGGAS